MIANFTKTYEEKNNTQYAKVTFDFNFVAQNIQGRFNLSVWTLLLRHIGDKAAKYTILSH